MKKITLLLALTSVLLVSFSAVAFAGPVYDATTGAYTGWAADVDSTMLQPVTDSLTGNLGVLLPVGITILAVLIGVALIPRIIWKFF